jgi:hypothetical protein
MLPSIRKKLAAIVLMAGFSCVAYLQLSTLGISEADLIYTEGRIIEIITVRSTKHSDAIYYRIENLPEKVAIRRGIFSADRISRSFKIGTTLKVGHTSEITWRNTINAYALSANGARVYGLESYARNYRSENKDKSWVLGFLTLLATFLIGTGASRRKNY